MHSLHGLVTLFSAVYRAPSLFYYGVLLTGHVEESCKRVRWRWLTQECFNTALRVWILLFHLTSDEVIICRQMCVNKKSQEFLERNNWF